MFHLSHPHLPAPTDCCFLCDYQTLKSGLSEHLRLLTLCSRLCPAIKLGFKATWGHHARTVASVCWRTGPGRDQVLSGDPELHRVSDNPPYSQPLPLLCSYSTKPLLMHLTKTRNKKWKSSGKQKREETSRAQAKLEQNYKITLLRVIKMPLSSWN